MDTWDKLIETNPGRYVCLLFMEMLRQKLLYLLNGILIKKTYGADHELQCPQWEATMHNHACHSPPHHL